MINETGSTSWVNTRVRKGEKYGTVIDDWNGRKLRTLIVKMDDGEKFEITMNNIGEDDPSIHEWEWYWEKSEDKKWYRF